MGKHALIQKVDEGDYLIMYGELRGDRDENIFAWSNGRSGKFETTTLVGGPRPAVKKEDTHP